MKLNKEANINAVQENAKMSLVQEQSVKLMEALQEYPIEHVLNVCQTMTASAIIEYSGKEDKDGNWKFDVKEAFSNSEKMKDNLDAFIHLYYSAQDNKIVLA